MWFHKRQDVGFCGRPHTSVEINPILGNQWKIFTYLLLFPGHFFGGKLILVTKCISDIIVTSSFDITKESNYFFIH